MMEQADVTRLSARFSQLIQERRYLDTAWLSLAEHFLPTRYTSIGEAQRHRTKEVLLNDKIVDATGIHAMRTLAAGLQGGMTSPARPWFRLGLEDDELANSRAVRSFLDTVAKTMRNLFHRSNFYNAIHTLYSDLATFGTAFMFEFGDFDSDIRFVTVPAGQYVIDVSATGRVDTVFRRMSMTTRQLLQEFGYEACPENVRIAHDSNKADQLSTLWDVVHAVYPRTDCPTCAGLPQWAMPYASVYWLESGGGGRAQILRESGFEDFPGFGPRWDSMAGSAYGRSPAMDCLPDCKMLQQMGITTLKAIHKSVDPPMGVSSSLKAVGLDLTPGGLNYVENMPGQAPQAATPLLQVRPEIQAARQLTQDVQNQIKQGLYNDLFKMLLSSDRNNVTAREVAAREEEKLILIGPVLERLHDELFIPLIDRTFNIMARFNMLPPLPPEMEGSNFKVEFVSLLAQAQKMVSTSAVDQLLAFTSRTAQAFPEVLDAIDVDNVMDGYAEYLGVEVDMIRPRQDREALRQQRAQAQAQAQHMSQIQQGVKVAKELGGIISDISGGTA
ncbi:MAG: portal protein [Desulfovibrionaceae bacterium]